MRAYTHVMSMREAALAAMQPFDFVLSPVSPILPYEAELAAPGNDPHDALPHIAFTVPYIIVNVISATGQFSLVPFFATLDARHSAQEQWRGFSYAINLTFLGGCAISIAGAATAPAGRPCRHSRRFLDDRGRCGDLRLVTRLGLRLPHQRCRLHRRSGGDAGLDHGRLLTCCGGLTGGGATLKRPQALFELPVAVLQFLVLAGELAKLVFQPLDPQFQVAIVGLGEGGRGKRERRGERHGPGNHMKSG